jgi:hypothetical protein
VFDKCFNMESFVTIECAKLLIYARFVSSPCTTQGTSNHYTQSTFFIFVKKLSRFKCHIFFINFFLIKYHAFTSLWLLHIPKCLCLHWNHFRVLSLKNDAFTSSDKLLSVISFLTLLESLIFLVTLQIIQEEWRVFFW